MSGDSLLTGPFHMDAAAQSCRIIEQRLSAVLLKSQKQETTGIRFMIQDAADAPTLLC